MHTVLVRKLGESMSLYPDVSLHLTLTNRVFDMAEDGIDLAFRAGVIRGSRMLLREWIKLQELEPLFGQYSPRNLWLYAAYTQRRHNSAAMNALLSFLEVEIPRYQDNAASVGESFVE